MTQRHIIIGDVHGCLNELEQLLAKVDYTEADKLIFIGDLLDKGPKSIETVKFVRELAKHADVILILGNHEEKYLRWKSHNDIERQSGKKNPIRHAEVLQYAPKLTSQDWQLLQSSVLYHKLPEFDSIVVHGGFGRWCQFIPSDPRQPLKLSGASRKLWMQLCRLRYETPTGNFVMLDKQTEYDVYWADSYDGRFGTAYFGHECFMQDEPKVFPYAYGIDLGCGYGGKLCAAVLEADDEPKFVTVDAERAYAEKYN